MTYNTHKVSYNSNSSKAVNDVVFNFAAQAKGLINKNNTYFKIIIIFLF